MENRRTVRLSSLIWYKKRTSSSMNELGEMLTTIFGFMHVLNPHNPFKWWWGFWTFFGGLVFGFIREKTGSVAAPAIIHGMPQAIAIGFFGWG